MLDENLSDNTETDQADVSLEQVSESEDKAVDDTDTSNS